MPVPFISATGSYLFAVKADDAPTARAALQILAFALDELGIGAKTSSGYGRITLAAPKLPPSPNPDYPVGAVFTGTVVDIDEWFIMVEPPKNQSRYIAVLAHAESAGKQYQINNKATVRVTAWRELKSGKVRLDLVPAKRDKEK